MSAYSNLVLATSGLVSYWRLGEPSGSVVDSKSAHNGTVTGATYGQTGLLTGDSDKALLYDADGDKVVIADHADFALTTGLTIEAWVSLDSFASGRAIFARRQAGGNGGYYMAASNSDGIEVACSLSGAGFQATEATGFTVGPVFHVVGTFDGAFLRIYKNGVQAAFNVQDWTGFPISTPASTITEIGYQTVGGTSWRGVIDEVAIYNVALSPATIAAHYALGHNGPGSVRLARQFQLRPY